MLDKPKRVARPLGRGGVYFAVFAVPKNHNVSQVRGSSPRENTSRCDLGVSANKSPGREG